MFPFLFVSGISIKISAMERWEFAKVDITSWVDNFLRRLLLKFTSCSTTFPFVVFSILR